MCLLLELGRELGSPLATRTALPARDLLAERPKYVAFSSRCLKATLDQANGAPRVCLLLWSTCSEADQPLTARPRHAGSSARAEPDVRLGALLLGALFGRSTDFGDFLEADIAAGQLVMAADDLIHIQ